MTVINSTLLRDRTLDTHLSDNALPLSTPVITITVTLASPAKKLSNVRFFQATYNEYNAVTSTKKVEQTVNVLIREEDTRLINATNKLTNDRPFLISEYLTIGEDKMILLELLDIDILYHLTAPPSKHPLQSPSSVKSTTFTYFSYKSSNNAYSYPHGTNGSNTYSYYIITIIIYSIHHITSRCYG
jgi:hypothetical protein